MKSYQKLLRKLEEWEKILKLVDLVYGYIINTYNIEPLKSSDLPLYVNAQYRGPMFEELLSGKRRLKCM
jgi:hypothetical protein